MFLFFKKQKTSVKQSSNAVYPLLSPLSGRAVPVEEVPDPTFAEKILGNGIAVIPDFGVLSAPADGVIDSVPDTFHAVMMTTDFGAELLMHIGIDTVELKGQHYRPLVSAGDRVKSGQPLIEFDRDLISAAGYEIITPMIVTNSDAFRIRQMFPGSVEPDDLLMELERK